MNFGARLVVLVALVPHIVKAQQFKGCCQDGRNPAFWTRPLVRSLGTMRCPWNRGLNEGYTACLVYLLSRRARANRALTSSMPEAPSTDSMYPS